MNLAKIMDISLLYTVLLCSIVSFAFSFEEYTPPPPSEECLQRERTSQVIKLYVNITKVFKDLFAVTKEDADKFENLILKQEQIRKPAVKPCLRRLPRFTECKIAELSYIFKRNKVCLREEGKGSGERPEFLAQPTSGQKTPPIKPQDSTSIKSKYMKKQKDQPKKVKPKILLKKDERTKSNRLIKTSKKEDNFDNQQQDFEDQDQQDFKDQENFDDDDFEDFDYDDENEYRRKRRSILSDEDDNNINKVSLKAGVKFTNSDGSYTEVRACVLKGSISRNEHLRLVKMCAATTTLPEENFPRYLNEVVCDHTQAACISGEGTGFQRTVVFTFRRDANKNLGISKLGDWEEYEQVIRTSCDCQMSTTSRLRILV